MLTNRGAFLGITGNLPTLGGNDPVVSHHITLDGDPAGGIMRAHDTFQVGSQNINISGPQYNDLVPTSGQFDPPPVACDAFRAIFK